MNKVSAPSLRYVPPGEGFRKTNPPRQYPNFSVTWHWAGVDTIFVTRLDRSRYSCVKVLRRFSVDGMTKAEAELQANRVAIRHSRLTPIARLVSLFQWNKGWPKRRR